ncbi:MAG: hypothetical protein H8E44_01815 [Planctomycetes bacterium]|nr:hypothetical protein [Planctomycetota bacterium]
MRRRAVEIGPHEYKLSGFGCFERQLMAEANREQKMETGFAFRFVAFGIVMAFVNILPYLITRGASGTDGLEIAGWPLRYYEMGGIGGHVDFSPWSMAGNVAIAVVVSAIAAWVFRRGVLRKLRELQTWGTPHAK